MPPPRYFSIRAPFRTASWEDAEVTGTAFQTLSQFLTLVLTWWQCLTTGSFAAVSLPGLPPASAAQLWCWGRGRGKHCLLGLCEISHQPQIRRWNYLQYRKFCLVSSVPPFPPHKKGAWIFIQFGDGEWPAVLIHAALCFYSRAANWVFGLSRMKCHSLMCVFEPTMLSSGFYYI